MKTGDTVQDGNGRSFQVGQLIGRGLWGKTYIAREDPSGSEWVLKLPLDPDAFSSDGEHLAKLCREIALETGRLLSQSGAPGLVRPEARFSTDQGVPILVMPRLGPSLGSRLESGATLGELLQAISAVTTILRALSGSLVVHGDLRRTNILSDGQGGWVLSDPATETFLRHLPTLARARGISPGWLPPEAQIRHEHGLSDPSVDSYALSMILLRGASKPRDGSAPPPPDEGLDKAALVALKDAVRTRLKDEPGNPRFHARLADRLATLLNRALSRETSPSPPYRFPRMDEFQARVEELSSLVQPRITHVGRVLLDRVARIGGLHHRRGGVLLLLGGLHPGRRDPRGHRMRNRAVRHGARPAVARRAVLLHASIAIPAVGSGSASTSPACLRVATACAWLSRSATLAWSPLRPKANCRSTPRPGTCHLVPNLGPSPYALPPETNPRR